MVSPTLYYYLLGLISHWNLESNLGSISEFGFVVKQCEVKFTSDLYNISFCQNFLHAHVVLLIKMLILILLFVFQNKGKK